MKSFLLICLAGFIGSCGDETKSSNWLQLTSTKQVAAKEKEHQTYYRTTSAGNFLAGQFAQRHQDWQSASHYLGEVLKIDPSDESLQKRAMILAMGSGQTDLAYKHAKNIVQTDPENELALLFIALRDFKKKKYKDSQATLNKMPDTGVTSLIKPIIEAWSYAGNNRFDLETLEANPINYYHAILIAGYLEKLDQSEEFLEYLLTYGDAMNIEEFETIGDIYAAQNYKNQALKIYRHIQKQRPENKDLDDKIAALELGQSTALKSRAHIKTAQQGVSLALFDFARVLFQESSDDSAIVFTRMALDLNPDLTDGKILLAHIAARHERYDDAIAHYNKIDPASPDYLDVQHRAADLLERAERQDDAISLLTKLYEEHGDIEALIFIGDIYRRTEKFDQSIAIYNKAEKKIGTSPIPEDYWNLLYSRGMSYEQNNNWPQAQKDLQAALRYRPDHPYLLNYLGYSWADRGENLSKSRELIEKAVALRPRDGYIADSLGWVLYRAGEYKQAVAELENAVELLPYDPTINEHLGDAYWRVGRKLEAKFQWRRAINFLEDPNQAAPLEKKIQIGLTNGNNETREAHSGTYEELNP